MPIRSSSSVVTLAGVLLAGVALAPGVAVAGRPVPAARGTSDALLARGFAEVRAAARPTSLVQAAAFHAASRVGRSTPLFGQTTTYYALQPDPAGAALVRFRTDGHAHVSGRTVLATGVADTVLAPTSSVGGTLVAMTASPAGANVVTVDSRGQVRPLTTDGHASFGLLTPGKQVLFATTNAAGETNGLASIDLTGRRRRAVYRDGDRDAVLSLPAVTPNGRTAYLVRNVFDFRGVPQSFLLGVDLASGRTTSRALPGVNYVTSLAVSPNGRWLGLVGYRASENRDARNVGFRAEADVVDVGSRGLSALAPRRVAWVQDPFVVFSRGSSRLVVGAEGRLVSVGVTSPLRDPLFGTEGLSLPVLAR